MALQRLGPFELIRVLGRGGMGTVYEAREDGSDARVAVKALAPQFSFDERFRQRFEGEIDALMKLEHPNIVRLLSYGQDEGNMYFAMELVEGNSLFQEQKKGQVFHWREIVDIGKQVCAGLRHAHDRGIIHRDLKPGNLMIDLDRRVKITDFGIAKSFGSSSVTREGNVLGTMDFMAPEQARGEVVTVKSDLFSLGAVLYSLLAGRPPFLQETVEQTFESLLSPNPPVRLDKIATDTPAPLAFLIHRLLEKDPSKRLATAMAAGRQLQHVAESVQGSTDSETQVVPAEESKSEILLGETFTPAPHSDAKPPATAAGTPNDAETRHTDVGGDIKENIAKHPDYFNEVTPQQRQNNATAGIDQSNSRAWPLLLALLVVVGLTAFGVWYAVIRTPSADDLLVKIRGSEDVPARVQDELELFIRIYPEHEQIAYVTDLMAYASAIKFRNTLSVRARAPRPDLSDVEQQFLEITGLSKAEAPEAAEQMEAYLAFHSQNENLAPTDTRVIEMAKVYDTRIHNDAKKEIVRVLEVIADAIQRAELSTSSSNKLRIYNFLIENYGEEPWAQELIEKCRQAIRRLESEESNPDDSEQKPNTNPD